MTAKSQWLKSWLNSLNGSFTNSNGVNCYAPYWLNGRSILSLDEGEFCRGPPYTMEAILEITIPSIYVVILLNLFAAFLLRRFRIQIYKYVKLHQFDRDECNGEDIDYDVFLACASEDGALGYPILKFLEENHCKVCYHKKDFIPGESISNNIINAIVKSKRVLCLLTKNFTKSGYCLEEFSQSHHRDLQLRQTRLVVLVIDQDVLEKEEISVELRDYLSRYTYIEYQSKSWMDRLMYAMPVNRMNLAGNTSHRDIDDESTLLVA